MHAAADKQLYQLNVGFTSIVGRCDKKVTKSQRNVPGKLIARISGRRQWLERSEEQPHFRGK